jgi:hypothetical protein
MLKGSGLMARTGISRDGFFRLLVCMVLAAFA